MDSTLPAPPPPSPSARARWLLCDRACYQTLWWPTGDTRPRAVPSAGEAHGLHEAPVSPDASARASRDQHDPHDQHNPHDPRASHPVHAFHTACLPLLPQPSHRLLAYCGEDGLRQIVHLHMQRLKRTPMFARAGRCFDCVAQRVADFVVESCGGPLVYSQRHARGVRAGAGLPLLLDAEGREIWLVQLWHAFADARLEPALCADFWGWAEPLSIYLMAPQARHPQLTRYPYDTVRSWFAQPRATFFPA